LCGQVTGVWFLLYLSLLFGTCRDDNDDDADKLLFLSLTPVFMCVLTEQPSDQLQKQHKYKEMNITQKR